jgi:hypothetical protein
MSPRSTTRPSHGSITLTVSTLLLLIVTGACGQTDAAPSDKKASSSTSKVDAAFIDRAEATCDPYAAYQANTFLELPGFNRYAPDPALLPLVADHLEQNTAYTSLVSDLEGLGDPESGMTAWLAVLDGFRENARVVALEITAARAGDAAQFGDLVGQLEGNKPTLAAALQAAGLNGASCAAAEVDPLKAPPAEH